MRWLIGVCRVGLGEVGVLGGWHFVLVSGQGLEGAGLAGSGSPEVAGFVVGGNDHGCFLPGGGARHPASDGLCGVVGRRLCLDLPTELTMVCWRVDGGCLAHGEAAGPETGTTAAGA